MIISRNGNYRFGEVFLSEAEIRKFYSVLYKIFNWIYSSSEELPSELAFKFSNCAYYLHSVNRFCPTKLVVKTAKEE